MFGPERIPLAIIAEGSRVPLMSDPEPIIELEPRNPFSWRVVIAFVVAWLMALGAALLLKNAMVRLLLPLIATIFVVYVGVCTLVFLKNRRR